VTILAILNIIGALVLFALVIVLVGLGRPIFGLAGYATYVAIVGIINLLLAYGLWNGKGWAWSVLRFFLLLGILLGVLSLVLVLILSASSVTFTSFNYIEVVISIAVDLLIFYYITRPHVKAFFGK
jgi:multisubunit Na+/H+ antiporter MnhB subunit